MLRSIVRHVRSALEPRPSAGERLLDVEVEGCRFRYPSRSIVGQFVAAGRGWDLVLQPILKELYPREPPVVVEVGSNIGASLIQMQIAQPNARFVCFEPSARFLPLLRHNVESNRWGNVRIEQFALGSATSEGVLFTNATTASMLLEDYDGHEPVGQERVTTTTMDDYFGDAETIDFVKVDTDGFELEVFVGGRKTLLRHRPVLLFEFETRLLEASGRRPEAVVQYLEELGYKEYLLLSNDGRALSVEHGLADVMRVAKRESYCDLLTVHSAAGPSPLRRIAETIGDRHSVGAF